MRAISIRCEHIELPFAAQVFWARISELPTEELDYLLHSLPIPVRCRILSFRREADRKASALSKWLLACCLGETLNPRRVFEALRYSESGRPVLDDRSGWDLSVSHSGDIAVCAVARQSRIGVDIEHKRNLRIEDFQDVFHPEVWEAILSSPARQDSFYEHWTSVEAVAKAEGSGLGGPVRTMRTGESTIGYQGRSWRLHLLPIDPEYTAHLAVTQMKS